MGCGRSSLPPDSPGGQNSSQRTLLGGSCNKPPDQPPLLSSTKRPPLTPAYSPATPPPVSPSLYDDPFSFFVPSDRTFDNSKTKDLCSKPASGILGLMEGLASGCRKGTVRAGLPAPEKGIPLTQETPKISDSQIDFFKMLDERIESGPDDESSIEAQRRAFVRSNSSQAEGSGSTPHPPPNRRWSASRLTTPRSPTNPEPQPNFTFIRCEKIPHSKHSNDYHYVEDPEDEECLLNTAETAVEWSPSDSGFGAGEQHKEQYMFLGNVYTVTRPARASGNKHNATISALTTGSRCSTPAHIAVTPVYTEEDLHVRIENGLLDRDYNSEKLLGGETTPDVEVDQFWMELDMGSDRAIDGKRTKSNKIRMKKSASSDIVRGGVLPLRTVME